MSTTTKRTKAPVNTRGSAREGEDVGNKKRKGSVFRLLALPPELWAKICRFAVLSTTPVIINGQHGLIKDKITRPPLTRVCRVIREETTAVFDSNCFVFDDTNHHGNRFLFSSFRILAQREPVFTNLVLETDFPRALNSFQIIFKRMGLQIHVDGKPNSRVHSQDDVVALKVTPLVKA
ncbi:hypothetical protein LTR17_018237 [Elasticomyces elasticus]|nr:hypothetical protein LTR17_018237 [Elasticomyces elasticus]